MTKVSGILRNARGAHRTSEDLSGGFDSQVRVWLGALVLSSTRNPLITAITLL